ncbi:MAG: transposase [Ferruginibacter sp.]|nr:transposase [Ferruginibacter sp.]
MSFLADTKYKDYADGSKQKKMVLPIPEFLRRFEMHFLPRRYVKIRHYGFLQNHGKTARLNAVRKQLHLHPLPPKINIPVAQRILEKYGTDISLCPQCKRGRLVLVKIVYPPKDGQLLLLQNGIEVTAAIRNKASP